MAERPPLEKPDLYVVARILERLWQQRQPVLRTKLQLAARTNYDTLCRYLEWMESKGLIRFEKLEGERDGAVLTQKGEEAYRRLVQWIDEVINGRFR
ncbi:MAG TPA: winged helix-turn-helix domain-containing protein [Methanomassiliicoccales archaeon]|jgi:predicted transcriptional regulator|nr:winged helix-turn-helix domain-containing protein [Methanomassiliicoccales archaeon]